MWFRSLYNNIPHQFVEDVDQTSTAVPDQSLSVRQILDRSSRGLINIDDYRLHSYDDSEPDIDSDEEDIDNIIVLHQKLNEYEQQVLKNSEHRRARNSDRNDGDPDNSSGDSGDGKEGVASDGSQSEGER